MKKKLLLIIFTICICFLCSNNVKATACIYKGYNNDGVYFMLDMGEGKWTHTWAKNFDSFEVNDEYQQAASQWANLKVYTEDGKTRNLTNSDHCFKYMFYDQKVGSNKIYFSDTSKNEYIEKSDLQLFRIDQYEASPEKTVLNEMICTYQSSDEDAEIDIHTISYRIKINSKNHTGKYELFANTSSLYKNDFVTNDNEISWSTYGNEWVYIDNMHFRLFWDEATGEYHCPSNIYVGTKNKSRLFLDLKQREIVYDKDSMVNLDSDTKIIKYDLQKYASYIDYEQVTEAQGEICTFSKPSNASTWDISLMENKYSDGTSSYVAMGKNGNKVFSNATIDIPSDIIYNSCDNLKTIYTDCLKKETCTISTEEFSGSERLDSNVKMNSQDYSTTVEGNNFILGGKYKQMLCSLSGKMKNLNNSNLYGLPYLSIYSDNGVHTGNYEINNLECSKWSYSDKYNCIGSDCLNNLNYEIENEVREIKNYCSSIYTLYLKDSDNEIIDARKEECFQFDVFYDDLVAKGIINDLSIGCDFITNELAEKLIWILDLLKIAGPIAALGLGTLDFVKAIASGDADKEMKSAFKRFTTRLIAAALLFIVPIILAFMMDTFLGNQDGYDSENPFCNIVDWTD